MGNLGSLFIFKYSGPIAQSLDLFISQFGFSFSFYEALPKFTLFLPVGISFYTFQSMSYTIDVYRNKLEPTQNILLFFAYLSMFPQLVAGPIIRAKDMLRQLQVDRPITAIHFWNGMRLVAYGFFQKVVLADNIAPFVNRSFNSALHFPSTLFWWLALIAFALQIYFDFSGYTSIARGLAKMMGYHFRMNFHHPYQAISLRDFWNRWHISLSTWFRDYVYIPLGGNRKGKTRGLINMWITMVLSGIWHGSTLNFAIWGAIHAFFLSIERLSNWPHYLHPYLLGRIVSWNIVFIQVLIAWVFFRSTNFEQAQNILSYLFHFNFDTSKLHYYFKFNERLFLVLGILAEIWVLFKQKNIFLKKCSKHAIYEILSFGVLVTASIYLRGPAQNFIYFQF